MLCLRRQQQHVYKGGDYMSEKEKIAFEPMSEKANRLTDAGYESAVLAITASYLAGKEAGKREAEQAEEKPGD